MYRKDRVTLVSLSIGGAVALAFFLLLVTGGISFAALLILVFAAFNGIINLQLFIYDIGKGGFLNFYNFNIMNFINFDEDQSYKSLNSKKLH